MISTVKTCFKCLADKPVDEFYRHPQMGDGYLNKCKECTKQDVSENREKNHDYYVWFDRIRANDPHRVEQRKAYAEKHRGLSDEHKKRWDARNSEKKRAHNLVAKAVKRGILVKKPCEVCGTDGAQAHHDDYTKPLVVRWLCPTHHGEHHRKENWFGETG